MGWMPLPEKLKFLSTPSVRRATGRHEGCCKHPRISIHALREEGDWCIILPLNRS